MIAIFNVGLLLGGATTASVILVASGLLSVVPETARFAVVLVFAAAAVSRDVRIMRFRLPAPTRQVPETVFARGPVRSALQFGFELGTGVRTQIPASAPYIVAAALALLGPGVITTLATGIAFGAGRAIMPLIRVAQTDTPGWDDLLKRRYRKIMGVSAVLCALAVAELVLATFVGTF
jgi:hypothetical protein